MWRRRQPQPCPGPPLAAGCDAKRDGMRQGRGRGGTGAVGAAQAGSHPCPFPPRAARPRRVHSLFYSLSALWFSPVPLPSLLQTRPQHCRAQAMALPHPAEIRGYPRGHPTPSGHGGKSLHHNRCIKIVKTLTSPITAGPEPTDRKESLPTHPDDAVELPHGHLLGPFHCLQDLLLVLRRESTGVVTPCSWLEGALGSTSPHPAPHSPFSHPSSQPWSFSSPKPPVVQAGL